MGKIKMWVALVLALCLLVGCTTPGQTTPTEPEEQPARPDGSWLDQNQQRAEKFGLSYQSDVGFNPYTTTRLTNRTLMSLMYQGLFTVTSEYRVEPVLCKTYSHTDDLKTYVFTLEAATFSDDTSLTAGDVVASLQAAQNSAVYGSRLHDVDEISATGNMEVTIKLKTAYEKLPLLLDVPIVRAEDVEAAIPLGTGPYVLQQGSDTRLVRRTDWWSDYVPVIDFDVIPLTDTKTPSDIRDEFEFGRTDLVCADPGANSYVEYRCDYELWECSTGIMLFLACNSKEGLFSNGNVRSALTYGVDREALTELYHGFAREASLPADPASDVYDQTQAAKYAVDLTKFRVALTDTGAAGKTVTLLVNSDSNLRVEAAEMLAAQLTEAGLVVLVEAKPESDYRKDLQAGEFDLFLGEVRLSPTFDLATFYTSAGALNYAGMADGNLNDLCKMALENSGNYYDLFEAVMADGQLCPLLFRTYAVYTTRGAIEGLLPAVDNVFHGSNTRQNSDALTPWQGATEPETTPATEETEETETTEEP